jgi:hypothetical protein
MVEYFVSYYDPETKAIKTGFVDARIPSSREPV